MANSRLAQMNERIAEMVNRVIPGLDHTEFGELAGNLQDALDIFFNPEGEEQKVGLPELLTKAIDDSKIETTPVQRTALILQITKLAADNIDEVIAEIHGRAPRV